MSRLSIFKTAGLLLAALCVVTGLLGPATAQAKGQQPNIVFIVTDDQPMASFDAKWMPNLFSEVVDPGTNFTDAIVNEPLCCPSRATLLTGQYAHNHGVFTNTTGYPALADPGNVLPVWLHRAGYRTGHFGKWLHGYEKARGTKPAPGWDRWVTLEDKRRYYDYNLSVDGKTVHKGHRPRDHVTAVTTRAASRFVHQNVASKDPLYLQVDYFAPHESGRNEDPRCTGATEPMARDKGAAAGEKVPRGPSFDEADVSDKPPYAQLPAFTADDVRELDRRYRCIAEAMIGVDRGVGSVIDRFREAHELRNTAFIFMTDNGLFLGEHRVQDGKSRPWDEALRTPLAMRLPRSMGQTRDTVRAQAAGIDIAPTILDIAGAEPCLRDRCRVMDGRSLVDPAIGDSSDFKDRAVLVELEEELDGSRRNYACAFQALRSSQGVFIDAYLIPDPQTQECGDGHSYEYYDLAQDPFELDNEISGGPASFGPDAVAMALRMAALSKCSGIEGRDAPSPAGYCE